MRSLVLGTVLVSALVVAATAQQNPPAPSRVARAFGELPKRGDLADG